jgi:hypothetical protein
MRPCPRASGGERPLTLDAERLVFPPFLARDQPKSETFTHNSLRRDGSRAPTH